jgi:hypothetical protein
MNSPVASFKQHPDTEMSAGPVRRVALEIEFLGPSARSAALALGRDLGGEIECEDPHAFRLRDSRVGTMAVETDLRYVHPARHPGLAPRLGPRTAALLGALVSPVVPRELITAPMPFTWLDEMDQVLDSLRRIGAWGRGAVFLDSLGLHFNVDPPNLEATTITAYLKAFLILSDDLRRMTARGKLRLRLALPRDYPQTYKDRVLAQDYWPGIMDLTKDYVAANPTRKRALDLLPLLTFLNPQEVRSALPREKISPRPAFHYRLPHAHLSDPQWSVLPAWNGWLAVERLATELGNGFVGRGEVAGPSRSEPDR